ncbi:methyltransferase domain-containing protein [Terasakiella pusilla]|uniref:methyltransferase domain-containing protein n=1 Tax=Terasakiella pusilla TaxID=64973 RepID=UPI003AA7E9F1
MKKHTPGLGELLRHLIELTDRNIEHSYKKLNIQYRPRYTPVMRALAQSPRTVSDLKELLSVTQGAISQTIKLMESDDLIVRKKGQDGRQSIIQLSAYGEEALTLLSPHWEATFLAIDQLEKEIDAPITKHLLQAVNALEQKSFAERIEFCKSPEGKAECFEEPKFKTSFQSDGKNYAAFRPTYPDELGQSLAQISTEHSLAVDVGCGTGQLTYLLSKHFQKVIGTDPSADQLQNAAQVSNITYEQGAAELINVDDSSVDLIVAAQAAHWFDLELFYKEVRRIAKPEAAIVLVSYGVPYIADATNSIFQRGYWQDIYEFWPQERQHVENNYSTLEFPFQPVPFADHKITKEMCFGDFVGYLTTWTAYKNAEKQGQVHKFMKLFDALREEWLEDETKEIVWPISIKAGRVS